MGEGVRRKHLFNDLCSAPVKDFLRSIDPATRWVCVCYVSAFEQIPRAGKIPSHREVPSGCICVKMGKEVRSGEFIGCVRIGKRIDCLICTHMIM